VAPILHWDEDQITGQINDYRAVVEREFSAAGLVL